MKNFTKLALFCLVIGFLSSCKNSKKEEAEAKVIIEQVETIEKEVDSISDSIEKEARELEDALNELDNI